MSLEVSRKKYRDDIRKKDIEQHMQKTRLRLLRQQSSTQLDQIVIEIREAEQQQTKKIKSKYPITYFYQFFTPKSTKEEQFSASFILMNYFQYYDIAPQSQFLDILMAIYSNPISPEIFKNILVIIYNIFQDYGESKKYLINKFNFAQKLAQTLTIEVNNYENHPLLLKNVYYLIHKSASHASFSKLLSPLFLIARQIDTNRINALNSTEYIYMIAIKNKQVSSIIYNQRFIYFCLIKIAQKCERKFIYYILDLILMCNSMLSEREIQSQVLPYLAFLVGQNFQYGTRSVIYSPYKIKIKCYQVLYQLIKQPGNFSLADQLIQLKNTIYNELIQSEDSLTLQSLAKIFMIFVIKESNQIIKQTIQTAIKRALQKCQSRYKLEMELIEIQKNCL